MSDPVVESAESDEHRESVNHESVKHESVQHDSSKDNITVFVSNLDFALEVDRLREIFHKVCTLPVRKQSLRILYLILPKLSGVLTKSLILLGLKKTSLPILLLVGQEGHSLLLEF